MATTSVPRSLVPGIKAVPPFPPTRLCVLGAARRSIFPWKNASTTANASKPRVLEKPAKFYPPSHPQRLVKQRTIPRQYPGPPVSEAQKEEQRTKQYPNMMPAEGTFMFWFLTSRMLHMCITLSVLLSLAVFVAVEDFHRNTPFADMLPAAKIFWSHPFEFIATYGKVYKLHTDHVSAETAERRRKKVDDVQKRSRYRKAHGLEKEQGFGGWTAKTDAELLGPAAPVGDSSGKEDVLANGDNSTANPENQSNDRSGTSVNDPSAYINSEPRRRPPVKRWLGIWS
ncbi:MAG: hypothetical protein Q9183_001474 [Haloplaca sp. 2 TL-2023]